MRTGARPYTHTPNPRRRFASIPLPAASGARATSGA